MTTPTGTMSLLEVSGLQVEFSTAGPPVKAVKGMSFSIERGQSFGLVGESGCGKSTTALALLRLLPRGLGRIADGSVLFDGLELTTMREDKLRQIRGGQVGFVFQDPMSNLNPVMSIGHQIEEMLRQHLRLSRRAARDRAIELLDLVGITDAKNRAADYPHQYSGGMRQRAMIAMAISCNPLLLIADEPTTGLDVTVQAQILELLTELQRDTGMAILLISHDLGVVSSFVDDVAVVYSGRIVETGSIRQVLDSPRHPYTQGLLRSLPTLSLARDIPLVPIDGRPPDLTVVERGCAFEPRCPDRIDICKSGGPPPVTTVDQDAHAVACYVSPVYQRSEVALPKLVDHDELVDDDEEKPVGPLLELRDIEVHFPLRTGLFRRNAGSVRAVDGVSLGVERGQTMGLVGESGSGKSTLARAILLEHSSSRGEVIFDGARIDGLSHRDLRKLRRRIQFVFQDPTASLDPRMRVADAIAEPLIVNDIASGIDLSTRVSELFTLVGLDPDSARRYPHEFSQGQRQRLGIARALATEPSLLVCDEPVSSLDVSIQAQVINLLKRLQTELSLSMVFIAHDISIVRYISDRIAVMYLGRIVEEGPSDIVCSDPVHPYTAALLSAVPDPVEKKREQRIVLSGEVLAVSDATSGCRFRSRCWLYERLGEPEICAQVDPDLALANDATDHSSACHFPSAVRDNFVSL